MSQEEDTPNVFSDDQSTANVMPSSETDNPNATSKMPRKRMKPRSEVWNHFTKFTGDDGDIKGKCHYYGKDLCCDPKKNGTASLRSHITRCTSYPPNKETNQSILNFQPATKGQDGGEGTLTTWKFDQEDIRNAIAYMIIVDELPFKFVENVGFNFVMSRACPRFRMPSRFTITRDCYQLYLDERKKLKSFLKNSSQRVCLTTDTWTSLQRINYMCLTAHFIDNDWKLNKKIINFCPISSHKGEAIGKAIEKCLLDWGIEKVMTITVDNASSNDVAISYLKKKFSNWGSSVLQGKFLHMRCIAHIINLVVVDGLKEMSESVARVRGAVRYVRQSPARFQKFKACVEAEKIQSKSLLCLDVSTRWNSTYLMLNAAQKFESAFERYEDQDPFLKNELELGDGRPDYDDWENVRRLVRFLEHFFELTIRVSGSLYVTSNTFFNEISELDCLLRDWLESDDYELRGMARRMKEKYDKYWGNVEKMNMLIYVATVLDPRHKLGFVEFALCQMYEDNKGIEVGKKVREATYYIFNEYKNVNSPQVQTEKYSEKGQSSSDHEPQQKVTKMMKDLYKRHKSECGGGENKSELDRYLSEDNEDDCEKFDILGWWKLNCPRFPILSQMARDVLAIPISTVASESAFSTGGRVLDAFRSSLTPKIVQALICTQDWLRSPSQRINVEENLEDLEILEKEIAKVALDENHIVDI